MKISTTQTADGVFSLASFAQSEEMFRLLGLHDSELSNQQLVAWLQSEMVTSLANEASGIIVDPRYDFDAAVRRPSQTGLIFRLTETGEQQPLPKILPNWGISQIKNNFGIVFLHLPYHPREEAALTKKKFVSEIYDFCQLEKVDLILDLEIVGGHGGKIHPDDLPEVQLTAVQELRRFCHLISLEYPGSPLQAATVTAELDVPWVLASADGTYAAFKEELREVVENGAKGFLVGKSLWQEIGNLKQGDMSPDKKAIASFLQTEARDRLIELSRIATEFTSK